jgi:hypothetical protein
MKEQGDDRFMLTVSCETVKTMQHLVNVYFAELSAYAEVICAPFITWLKIRNSQAVVEPEG